MCDTKEFQALVNKRPRVFLGMSDRVWCLRDTIVLPSYFEMYGRGATVIFELGADFNGSMFEVEGGEKLLMHGIRFDCSNNKRGVVYALGSDNTTVDDCEFTGEYREKQSHYIGGNSFIKIDDGNEIVVKGSRFYKANRSMLYCNGGSSNIQFVTNVARDIRPVQRLSGDGVEFGQDGKMIDTGSGLGVHLDSINGKQISNAKIKNNFFINTAYVVHARSVTNLNISHNSVHGAQTAISVCKKKGETAAGNKNVVIKRNELSDCRDEAVFIDDTSTASIERNTVDGCEFGLSIRNSKHISTKHNVISNATSEGVGNANGVGIVIRNCENATLKRDEIYEHGKRGLWVHSESTDVVAKSMTIKSTQPESCGVVMHDRSGAKESVKLSGMDINVIKHRIDNDANDDFYVEVA